MDTNIRFQVIDDTIWPEVKELIRTGWNKNHIFLKSDTLLKWHYSGFGENKNNAAIAVFDKEKLIGFRLFIPIELSIAGNTSKYVRQSVVSTLYYLSPEYRGMKIGLAMQLYMLDKYKSFFAIASNLQTSAPIYKKTGAFLLDKMFRYILPLGSKFSNIMKKSDIDISADIFSSAEKKITPKDINPNSLAEMWFISTSTANITSLNRTKQFWEWRYKESPIYKYVYFGGKEDGCVIVGRICNLFDEDSTQREEKVFRILEFIPMNKDVWSGTFDSQCNVLLERVSKWAQENDCVACEFYITTNCFEKIFTKVGFKEINVTMENEQFDCISYFEPCAIGARLCNVSLYVQGYDGTFDFNKSYFTLSDADQDRPNILQ